MTYFFILRHSERSEESHRRTDRHILLTLVVGYFAYAQYDGIFYPLSSAMPTLPPKEEARFVLLSLRESEASKQSPGRVEVYEVYVSYFFGGIAAVAMLPRNDNKF